MRRKAPPHGARRRPPDRNPPHARATRRLILLALAVSPVPASAQTPIPPGGHGAGAGNSSAFTYGIPIEVPSGRHGMALKFTLTYNSLAGDGWDLPIGHVTRSTRNGVNYGCIPKEPRFLDHAEICSPVSVSSRLLFSISLGKQPLSQQTPHRTRYASFLGDCLCLKAHPAKAGAAKPRGYRRSSSATPVGPPKGNTLAACSLLSRYHASQGD